MYTFSSLLRFLRREAKITQKELAEILGVSKVLIVMIENNTKEPSKKFVLNLADKLKIHPSALMPFVSIEDEINISNYSGLEKKLLQISIQLQEKLLKKKALLLK